MSLLDSIHGGYVARRRLQRLAALLPALLPRDAHVLDVGCGGGELDRALLDARPDLSITGVDVLLRPERHIEVTQFDGVTLPFDDRSFDAVQFVDVLHHTEDPSRLLREAARVARQAIVLKDHLREGLLAQATLRWMDDVGNTRFGVALPHNYWRRAQWMDAFAALGLTVESMRTDLHMYPAPLDWIFGRGLHFIARLRVA